MCSQAMKKKDIPQDESSLNSKNLRELYYVEDESGNYSTGLSTGWEPKKIALDLTLERIAHQLEEIKLQIQQKKWSPIQYFMVKTRMDIGILSSYVNKPRWLVKRHCKYTHFNRLSTSTLQKYADVFEINIDKLTHFNE